MMRWDMAGFVGRSTPAMPIRWVVQGGNPLQPQQQSQVQARLQAFLQQCRLSPVLTQWANGVLPDGSRYRLYAHNGAVEVVVAPMAMGQEVSNYAAWPVFYEPGYVAPLYEREFLNDEPVPLGYIVETVTYQNFSQNGTDLGVFEHTRTREIHIRDFAHTQSYTFTPTKWDDGAYGVHSFSNWLPGVNKNIDAPYGTESSQSTLPIHQITSFIDGISVNDSRIVITTRVMTDGGSWIRWDTLTIPRALERIGNFEAGTGTEYWRGVCNGTVVTDIGKNQASISVDVQATLAVCDAIIEELRPKPHPLIMPKRIEGRQTIGAGVTAWCKAGLGNDPHRNARILRFPYLTRYKPKGANVLEMLQQGSVGAPSVEHVGADDMVKQVTRQSIFDAAYRKTATPWKGLERGQELAALDSFRSGVVNATLSQLAVTTPDYHGGEPAQCIVNAFTSVIPSWMVAAQSLGLQEVQQQEQGAPIVFDSQIPAGVRLVLLHLEYEVFDPYTGTWIWCAVPKMVNCDAVWVPPLSNYYYVHPEGEPSIRAVRSVGATVHVRSASGWSAPSDVPSTRWSSSYVTTDLNVPSAIAIAINLPPDAYPASATGPGVLWKGGLSNAAALRKQPVTDVSHICAHALKLVGVDK